MTTEHTIEAARQFVSEALEGFVYDPADSDFQRGYLEALYQVGQHALGMKLEKAPPTPAKPVPHLRIVKSE